MLWGAKINSGQVTELVKKSCYLCTKGRGAACARGLNRFVMSIVSAIICAVSALLAGVAAGILLLRSRLSALDARLGFEKEGRESDLARHREELARIESDWKTRVGEREAEAERRAGEQRERFEALIAAERSMAKAELRRAEELLASEKEKGEAALAAERRRGEEALRAEREKADALLESQKKSFEDISSRLVAESRNATRIFIEESGKKMSEAGSANIRDMMAPLRETVDQLKKDVAENREKQISLNTSLRDSMERIIRNNEEAMKHTDELTRALRHQPKVQGDWGEKVLADLLTAAGLSEGLNFDTQVTLIGEDGKPVRSELEKSLRPDLVLYLDTKREIIIDSKVSLTDYITYANSGSDEERCAALKAHTESVRRHVRELAGKSYSKYHTPGHGNIDYVIMFVPNSAAMWAALREDPSLWRDAMKRGVYIADEQTLYAALNIIRQTWVHIAQVDNQQRVFALADELLDRVGQFAGHYGKIGDELAKLTASYDAGKKKISSGGQSILTTCEKLKAIGAKESTKNPLPVREGEYSDAPQEPGLPDLAGTADTV